MSIVPENIEKRLAKLETEAALIKSKLQSDSSKSPWWELLLEHLQTTQCMMKQCA